MTGNMITRNSIKTSEEACWIGCAKFERSLIVQRHAMQEKCHACLAANDKPRATFPNGANVARDSCLTRLE